MKHLYIFNFIKSETSDSLVNHFDGHFAYLKTLDFYFNPKCIWELVIISLPFYSTPMTRGGGGGLF